MTFQTGASLLDACVLAIAAKGDTYGYQLNQNLRDAFDLSPSTLYPVLRRLQADNCLVAYDEQYEGRNRRYYGITDKGRGQLETYQNAWIEYKEKVSKILGGDDQ